jgi:HSP20 family protein
MYTLTRSEYPLLRKFGRDVDAFIEKFGLRPDAFETDAFWTPALEVFEKDNEFIVRADVPGLKKEELTIEITELELTIKGERRQVKEDKEDRYYKSERTYGTFYRVIPLPEGVKVDQAKAVVRDGVLEVKLPFVKVVRSTRRLDVEDAPTGEKATRHAA